MIQELTGHYPNGVWSYAVPGRTVYVQLVSDLSIADWGFCVDQITSTERPSCLAESPHPYPNDYDHTWTVTNPDAGATSSRVHFARLEAEAFYDYVLIKDGSGNEIQRIDGSHLSGLWSNEVPGRVVQVQLVTDFSVGYWGFCVDEIETVGGAGPTGTATTPPTPTVTATGTTVIPSPTLPGPSCLIESEHPYANHTDASWTLTNPDPGATVSKIHFARMEVEVGWDAVLLKDGSGNLVEHLDGHHPGGFWSAPIPGRVVQVQLLSDHSVTYWGFCVDQIANAEMYACLAASDHPYANSEDRTWTLTNPDTGAQASRVHFLRLETQNSHDYVVVADGAGNEYQRLHGVYLNGVSSVAVPGRVVRLRLVTDSSDPFWGFCVDYMESASSSTAPTLTPLPTLTRTQPAPGERVFLPIMRRRTP